VSNLGAALTILALLNISLPALYCHLRRATAAEAVLNREAHERADAAAELDDLELAWNLPDYNPDLAAELERLRNAIREHREEDPS